MLIQGLIIIRFNIYKDQISSFIEDDTDWKGEQDLGHRKTNQKSFPIFMIKHNEYLDMGSEEDKDI